MKWISFSLSWLLMWMDLECETSLVAKTPKTRQHFLVFSASPEVYPMNKSMASLFFFFCGLGRRIRNFRSTNEFSPTQTSRGGTLLEASFLFLVTTPLLFLLTQSGGSCGVREPRRSRSAPLREGYVGGTDCHERVGCTWDLLG